MSIGTTCPSCANGNHEGHNYGFGLLSGLIGGHHCACVGDCGERSASESLEFFDALAAGPRAGEEGR